MRRSEDMPRAAVRAGASTTGSSASSDLLARLERYEARAQSAAAPRDEPPGAGDDDGADDPVTPELALVDPALASRERLRLPERPTAAVVREEPEPIVAAPPAPVEIEWSGRRRRPRRRRVFLGLAVLALTSAALIAYPKLRNREDTQPPTRAPLAASTTVGTVRAKASPPASTATRPAKPKPKPKANKAAPAKRQRPASHRRAGKHATTSPAVPETRRTFAWVPSARARYYLVEFFRGRREILRASPSTARLVLPSRWSFHGHSYALTPGTYRWSVRPGFGAPARHRYGKPIVQAKLVIQRAPGG